MNLRYQLKSNKTTFLRIFIISTFFIGCVLLLNKWKGIPIGSMTRDITTTAGVEIYVGFFSQVGFFFWIAAATLCMFTSFINHKSRGNIIFTEFLFLFGLLTLLLCLDDMFLLHESVFPYIFGIPQKGVFMVYGILIFFILLRYYQIILKTNYIILAMSFIFFAISISLDVIHPPNLNPYLMEDSVKMFGIVSWFFYFYSNATFVVSKLTTANKNSTI